MNVALSIERVHVDHFETTHQYITPSVVILGDKGWRVGGRRRSTGQRLREMMGACQTEVAQERIQLY